MKLLIRKARYDSMMRVAFTMIGIATNVVLSFIAFQFDLQIYLDTVGTIIVAAVGGLFPGIMTAVLSNVFGAIFNHETIYYGFINALIAIYTAWFVREKSFSKVIYLIRYVTVTGVMSGTISAFIQWGSIGKPQKESFDALIEALSAESGLNHISSFIVISIIVNIVDKCLSLLVALIVIRFIPGRLRERIRNSGWKQSPLSVSDVKKLNNLGGTRKGSLRFRLIAMLLSCSLALTFIMSWVGIALYYENNKMEMTKTVQKTARFAGEVLNSDMIEKYIEEGENVPGYLETKGMLEKIRDNAVGVEKIYIFKPSVDGFYCVFDIDADDENTLKVGKMREISAEEMPFLDELLAGREIEPLERDTLSSWVLTAYYPIRDESGICRCYASADVSLTYMSQYMSDFLLHVLFVMAGFYILIFAFGLWSAGTYMFYPVNSIVLSVEKFIEAGDDQSKLDTSIRGMRALDIHTGDEIERLYHVICDMALDQTEKIRSIRRLSDATLKMQEGLIITMADMVENRDSDTGAHIQKTAEYVRIITEALLRKGYYTEKISSKFLTDVVTSAPLHDIGKINISDKILNKPGKLTAQEYEIMKTHTTAGREIIEKAINTVKGENYLKEARNMAAYHHERWDGTGYPDGLHGEVIPLSARIMAVADVLDALTSSRVYKPPYPLEEAVALIREESGTHFDPKIVEALMDSIPEVKVVIGKYNH